MPDPAIIVAGLGAGVSLATAASHALAKRRDRVAASIEARAEDSAEVQVARLGQDATLRAQLHNWLEEERDGHHTCLEEVARVRVELIEFKASHPDCHERIAELTERVRTLESSTTPPPPAQAAE